MMREQARRGRGGKRKENEKQAPSAGLVRKRHRDFRQPFVRLPCSSGKRVGKWIAIKERMIGEHARTGGDMKKSIAIVQHLRRKGDDAECDARGDQRDAFLRLKTQG